MPAEEAVDPLLATDALAMVREELAAMDPRLLVTVNVDVTGAAMTVIGALKNILPYRPALVEELGERRVQCIDRLEVLARAAMLAQARYIGLETTADLTPMITELTKMRDVLHLELRAAVARDVLPAGHLGALSRQNGHRNLGADVLQLVGIFQQHRETLEGNTAITAQYLKRVEVLVLRLMDELGIREQAGQSETAELRQRAFTLLSDTYNEARRLITFLRWHHGDYDRIAPSFFAGRATGRRRNGRGAEATPTLPVTEEPIAPGLPGAPPFVEEPE